MGAPLLPRGLGRDAGDQAGEAQGRKARWRIPFVDDGEGAEEVRLRPALAGGVLQRRAETDNRIDIECEGAPWPDDRRGDESADLRPPALAGADAGGYGVNKANGRPKPAPAFDRLIVAADRLSGNLPPQRPNHSEKVDIMEGEFDWLYTPTTEDRAFFAELIAFVHAYPDLFTKFGRDMDKHFSTKAIRAWEPRPDRVWEDEEQKKRPAIPLNERFGFAVANMLDNRTILSVLDEPERIELASHRVLLYWLLLDPTRRIPRRENDRLLTLFQSLRNVVEGELPDFERETAADELDVDEQGRLSPEFGANIPSVREALEFLKQVHRNRTQPDVSHAPDYTSVVWYGTRYTFSKGQQAEAVRLLWEAWKSGGHGMAQEVIGDKISSNNDRFRLAHLFRKHPAWDSMIRSAGKGVYRLVPPAGQ